MGLSIGIVHWLFDGVSDAIDGFSDGNGNGMTKMVSNLTKDHLIQYHLTDSIQS